MNKGFFGGLFVLGMSVGACAQFSSTQMQADQIRPFKTKLEPCDNTHQAKTKGDSVILDTAFLARIESSPDFGFSKVERGFCSGYTKYLQKENKDSLDTIDKKQRYTLQFCTFGKNNKIESRIGVLAADINGDGKIDFDGEEAGESLAIVEIDSMGKDYAHAHVWVAENNGVTGRTFHSSLKKITEKGSSTIIERAVSAEKPKQFPAEIFPQKMQPK